MGSEEHKEIYYAFEILYWCGIRMGELLALTPKDFDFGKCTLTINKSYQRLKGRAVITSPKTPKSNRTIKMSKFLCEEIQEYIDMLYSIGENERLFPITKSYLHHKMDRGSKQRAACKFINETNHVENDYIFQLDPLKFISIPQYYLDEIENFFDEEKSIILSM